MFSISIEFFRNILEKGQKLLTFILYDVLVLKETPFKKSGSTSMPGELPELFPFPKNKTEHENSTAAT